MALSDEYESVRREILKRVPLPSVRDANATVRREAVNNGVLKQLTHMQPEVSSGGGIGAGLATRSSGRPGHTLDRGERTDPDDKSRLFCSHCGKKKHTKEHCFLLVGYPEWWDEMKKRRASRSDVPPPLGRGR